MGSFISKNSVEGNITNPLTSSTSPLNATTQFGYDDLNRLIQTSDPTNATASNLTMTAIAPH
jgi:YD repeat-containing protein